MCAKLTCVLLRGSFPITERRLLPGEFIHDVSPTNPPSERVEVLCRSALPASIESETILNLRERKDLLPSFVLH